MSTAPTRAEVIEILATLVGFDSTSHLTNLPLIQWVEDYLDQHGVWHVRVQETAEKSSLLARIGPNVGGGVVLSGHTDVVPVIDQPWNTDPFVLHEEAGKLFGRGTCDMKSFLALALAYVPLFKEAALSKPIWFAFSHDEEVGCLGAAPMAQALNARDAEPRMVVVGEPTNMELVTAHKGIMSFETTIIGKEAHSSMPHQGANAVHAMGELLAVISNIRMHAQAHPPASANGFTPAYSTVHVGVAQGGTARNIIPRHARLLWEVRPVPGEDVDALIAPFFAAQEQLDAAFKTIDSTCGVSTERKSLVLGLAASEDDTPHVEEAMHLSKTNQTHYVAYGTEGGIFQKHGLPVVICGPGSIDQAHQPNEFVSLEQIDAGMAWMQRLANA